MEKKPHSLLFACYIWLADTILSAGRITKDEIDHRWSRNMYLNEDHEDVIPERTFHRWRIAVEELFSINILCDKKDRNVYYVEDDTDLRNDELKKWLISSFSLRNLIHESEDMKDYISLESIPSGQKFLTVILMAIRDGKKLKVSYRARYREEDCDYTIAPYCIKLFKQRWYLVGQADERNNIRVYSLERIHSISPTDITFKVPKDFSCTEYFRYNYGVSHFDNTKPQIIRVKVFNDQARYLRELPIHQSQKEMETTDTYSVFEYFLVPNYEFTQELRTHGSNLEVLEPQSLRDEFKAEAEKNYNLYH